MMLLFVAAAPQPLTACSQKLVVVVSVTAAVGALAPPVVVTGFDLSGGVPRYHCALDTLPLTDALSVAEPPTAICDGCADAPAMIGELQTPTVTVAVLLLAGLPHDAVTRT